METLVYYFVYILMGVILSLVNDSICVPFVTLKKRQISGRTIKFGGYEVNEYLGIRYAQPPVGPLRFQKTQELCEVPGKFEAVNMPPACHQYTEYPYPWYVNGSYRSEDCLFLNIWTPVDASLSNQKAVLFWLHGGGFKLGSIQDRLYCGVALAAIGDIIVVTVNYRLGAFGFLTTDTDEAPGNAGLWDILEALKWVNQNIEFFGGDTSRITIAGESAGAITVGYLSISPLGAGLFGHMIMESGSPGMFSQETKPLNLALAELLAEKVGCANDSHSLMDHRQSVTECLKMVEAGDLERAEFEILPNASQDFLPQYGDELLPKGPRNAVFNGEFRCKKLLIGHNSQEASIL
ncbi:Acetylcholinesterase-1, partial [Araneus ventricosus]